MPPKSPGLRMTASTTTRPRRRNARQSEHPSAQARAPRHGCAAPGGGANRHRPDRGRGKAEGRDVDRDDLKAGARRKFVRGVASRTSSTPSAMYQAWRAVGPGARVCTKMLPSSIATMRPWAGGGATGPRSRQAAAVGGRAKTKHQQAEDNHRRQSAQHPSGQ